MDRIHAGSRQILRSEPAQAQATPTNIALPAVNSISDEIKEKK